MCLYKVVSWENSKEEVSFYIFPGVKIRSLTLFLKPFIQSGEQADVVFTVSLGHPLFQEILIHLSKISQKSFQYKVTLSVWFPILILSNIMKVEQSYILLALCTFQNSVLGQRIVFRFGSASSWWKKRYNFKLWGKKTPPLLNSRIAPWFENLTSAIRGCFALKINKNSFLTEVTMAGQRRLCPHGAVFSLVELLEHRDLGRVPGQTVVRTVKTCPTSFDPNVSGTVDIHRSQNTLAPGRLRNPGPFSPAKSTLIKRELRLVSAQAKILKCVWYFWGLLFKLSVIFHNF